MKNILSSSIKSSVNASSVFEANKFDNEDDITLVSNSTFNSDHKHARAKTHMLFRWTRSSVHVNSYMSKLLTQNVQVGEFCD